MIVRIIVDGYNLLHAWKEIAPKKVRYSEDARQELIKVLTWYSDASISPVTVIFDGRAEGNHPENDKTAPKGLEILYTPSRASADQLIERATILYAKYGQVMAVTNDHAIRDLVIANGGTVCSCENFVLIIQDSCHELNLKLKYHNQDMNNRFKH